MSREPLARFLSRFDPRLSALRRAAGIGRTRRMTETILLLATRGLNWDLRHQVPGEIHGALLFTTARNVAPS